MKTLLLTGANGFVGRHVLAHAAQHDPALRIIAITRQAENPATANVDWHHMDMLDTKALEHIIRDTQPDAIMHLAAASSVGYSWQQPRDSVLNNLDIYINLLEAVRQHAPKTRLLSVGSSEVYGQVSQYMLPLAENIPPRPVSPYAVARTAQEDLSRVYAGGYNMDIVLTRSFNHFGPGQDARFALPSFAQQIAQARKSGAPACRLQVGNIDVIRDFTDVRDVVRGYFALLEKGKRGEIYNICSGQGRSLRGVIEMMGEAAGIEIITEEDATKIRPQDLPMIYGSNNKMRDHVGWTPQIDFPTTVRDIMQEWLDRAHSV